LEQFDLQLDEFEQLSARWRSLTERKRAMPSSGLSTTDREKLNSFEELIRIQLREFGFSSLDPDSLSLSTESYKPTREGFNLGFDLSASDNIRIIWAYLEGLLELAADFELRHPNLLILDEPRQQEAAQISFEELLRRSAQSAQRNQQILFATSEPFETIARMREELGFHLIDFSGRVIQHLPS
jgi:hypothetical protein